MEENIYLDKAVLEGFSDEVMGKDRETAFEDWGSGGINKTDSTRCFPKEKTWLSREHERRPEGMRGENREREMEL